jgi:thiamine biosynthesis lipoprotein
MENLQFRAMNTDVMLAAEGDARQVQTGFEVARRFIEESEQRFSRFLPDSELSQLNKSGGAWFRASPDLLDVILLAQGYVEQTGGLFDPSILPDLRRAGYDRSMDLMQSEALFSLPDPHARKRTPFDAILIHPEEALISLPNGLSLDLGGIAKGWIAEQAALLLSQYSQACGVSAGGDMYMHGLPREQESWPVALDDPLHPGETLALLHLPPGGVATSSVTKRVWKQGEMKRHHLIDPRSGEPALTEWLSVTVIAEHTDLCEVFAKALLIGGPREAQAIAENAAIAYLAVDRQGNLCGTQKSLEYAL